MKLNVRRLAGALFGAALRRTDRSRRGRTGGPGRPRGADSRYAPRPDGHPDPGEVVWAWVPFEEDSSRGKDRPVLVIGVTGDRMEALPMTSKDHDRDAEQEARAGRYWMDVGRGPWDALGRPSEVRLNRILNLRVEDVRREGAAIDPQVYDHVLEAHRQYR